jgi:hypothetical protein
VSATDPPDALPGHVPAPRGPEAVARPAEHELDPSFALAVFALEDTRRPVAPNPPTTKGGAVDLARPVPPERRAPDAVVPRPHIAQPTDPDPLPVPPAGFLVNWQPHDPPAEPTASRWKALAVVVTVAAILGLLGAAMAGRWTPLGSDAPALGRVRLDSSPGAAQVFIDGHARGTTPVALALAPGEYAVRLEAGVDAHTFRLQVHPGQEAVHHVHMATSSARPDVPSAPIATASAPAGASASPASSGAVPSPAAAPSTPRPPPRTRDGAPAGWLRVDAPVELEMTLDGYALGNSRRRTLLPVGEWTVEFACPRTGYRTTRIVRIKEGEVTSVRIDVPTGRLSITAEPWAEVMVGGTVVGRTPITGLSVPVGTHDVRLRHPELGERRYEAVIEEGGHTVLSADLTLR